MICLGMFLCASIGNSDVLHLATLTLFFHNSTLLFGCRTWHEDNGKASLNSEGLPNNGIDYYISPQTISETMDGNPNKPYMVSISGKNLADNLEMLKKISSTIESGSVNIAAVELNLACPNIVGKPTIGYDFEQMEDVLKQVASLPCFSGSKPLFPLGVKMP